MIRLQAQRSVISLAALYLPEVIICPLSMLNNSVRFAMDRAGMVGADGATHCGAFDIAYMASLPNMVCMAPSNEAELINMVRECGGRSYVLNWLRKSCIVMK